MKFQYFKTDLSTNLTIEDAKKQYYKLCLRWHPDRPNGDLKAMQTINAEWDYIKAHNYNVHTTKSGSTYTDWSQQNPDDVTERFAEIIERLIHLEGLIIEICGTWLWVSGDTKTHKGTLKEIGMRWAPKKAMWYMKPEGWRKRSRKEYTIDEIRSAYGSIQYASKGAKELQA